MSSIFIIFGLVFMTIAIATLIGLTLNDVRAMQLADRTRRHPYAKALRSRPLVSVLVAENATKASLHCIRMGDYRKTEIVFPGEKANGPLWMTLPSNVVVSRAAISSAVRRFNTDPTLGFVELTPVVQTPQNLWQLFDTYRLVVHSPFISVRSAFRIVPGKSLRPLIYKPNALLRQWHSRVYQLTHWIFTIINVVALLYFGFVAVFLAQPELLLAYIIGFYLWVEWAIWQYPYFSLKQRVSYTLLAPVSFSYFLWLAFQAPFICHAHRFKQDPFSQPWQAFARDQA